MWKKCKEFQYEFRCQQRTTTTVAFMIFARMQPSTFKTCESTLTGIHCFWILEQNVCVERVVTLIKTTKNLRIFLQLFVTFKFENHRVDTQLDYCLRNFTRDAPARMCACRQRITSSFTVYFLFYFFPRKRIFRSTSQSVRYRPRIVQRVDERSRQCFARLRE